MKNKRTTLPIFITTALMVVIFALTNCSKDDPDPVNGAPIANAGPDQKVEIGETVTLNGIDSSDPEEDALTYQWSILSAPATSSAAITGATSVQATFPLDKAGVYTIELTISDGEKTAKDEIIITNKTPIINTVDPSGANFPAFEEGLVVFRTGSIFIKGAFFGNDTSEMKVTLNDQLCSITWLGNNEMGVKTPENASSGELALTVGEEKVVFSKPIFVYTTPALSFIELPTVTSSSNGGAYFEFGVIIRPKKNGKILGFRNNIPGANRCTLWDFDSKQVIADATYNGSNHIFPSPIAVKKGKEYMVTANSDSWEIYNSSKGNIFPTGDLYDDIEITGYGSASGASQQFPTFITRDQASIAGIADVYFIPDL